MIKKLRRKFVIINMLFVFIVLLCVFVAVFISSSQSLTEDINRSLTVAVDERAKALKITPGNGVNSLSNKNMNRDRGPKIISVYAFCMTDDGYPIKIIQSNNLIDEEELSSIAKLLTDAEHDKVEELEGYNLYYYKHRTPNGYIAVSLADTGYYYSSMYSMLLYSLTIGTVSLIAFFFISLFLSKWALKPVEKAWLQQKQFIADASHELKTPLTVILANTKILSGNKSAIIEEQMKWIDSTQEEAQNMKRLVESMLFLARSDAQSEQIKVLNELVAMSELTETAALQFEPVAYERSVELETKIDENVMIHGDSSQLKQLLQILLDNACKYTPVNGRIVITLTKAQLSVFNSGTPIPKESLPHLFERFYRSDEARSDPSSFGLGLAIAKTVAANHGGTLIVESSEEIGGTRFVFNFTKEKQR
ncbi:MAG: sensor histidine kinase [Acutalibacteraceae bacterium]